MKLKDEFYIHQSKGFGELGSQPLVCKLKKALYEKHPEHGI